ncbi:unnamed protein product, partial [Rotaria sp. Silwood1]
MTEKSTLNNELINELSSLVLNTFDINEDAKEFLLIRLENSKSVYSSDQLKMEHRFKSTGHSNSNKKMNKLVVTKTIQTVKSSYNNKQSEETQMIFMNLSDALKNRNRTLNMNTTLEAIDTVNDTTGNDRSMWRTTWGECVSLYTLVVVQGQALKSDDKDNYLPGKLFGTHIIMIIAILLRTSKKQQLNNDAINKLMTCVTDLDTFVSAALDSKYDIIDLFVNSIYAEYNALSQLQEPDIVALFVKTIINKTIEVVVHKGWLWNSTEVKQKAFNETEITKIIKTEINKIRLDGLNAIYNCSLRNKKVLTKDRINKIQKCLTNYQDNDAKFTKLIFQLMNIANSTNEIDYKTTFETYTNVLVRGPCENSEMIINFMNNQAKDAKRSKELFTDEVLEKLINLLNSYVYDNRIKEDIMEIINNYLEHETNKALKDEHLELLIEYVLESDDSSPGLINFVLTSILIIVEKSNSLSEDIMTKLINNMECLDKSCSNYILLILSRAIREGNYIQDEQDLENISHKLASNDVVQLDEDSKITFEERSEKNQHCNQISLLTAKIILLSVENQMELTNKTIDNLVLALNNDDKQTKIISSKCIYLLSKYMPLENDVLSQMKDFINNQIYDVSVYILSAYSYGLVKLAKLCKPIESIFMENLSSLFVTQSLKLGAVNYANEINLNILEILKFEASKQKFEDENIFVLLDGILLLNENHSIKVLEILQIYTNTYTIPISTIKVLENALGFPEQFEKAIYTIHNVIRNGQPVTNKILQILIDDLYMSINARRRYNSFKLLEKTRKNQDLPDNIFYKLELTKAGLTLSRSTNKKSIIKFMQDQTSNGMQLPIDTVNALESEIKNEDTLQVLYNISKNKQIIQYDLLNKLIDTFNPNSNQFILIGVFENVAKNNQTLSAELLNKLEMALSREEIEDNILSIFVYLAQKGEKLSENIIQKILDRILIEKDIMLKQEFLSTLGSLIQTHKTDIKLYKKRIEEILMNEINSDNNNLQKISINVLRILVKFVQVDSNLLNEVIAIGTSLHCDKTIKDEIYSLFIFMEENNGEQLKKYKAKMELANLNYKTDRELLNKLNAFASREDGLLEQNYNQLKNIIDQDFELQEKALEILHLSKSKNKMTDDLIESIVLLHESINSKDIKYSCSKLLEDAKRSGKILNHKAVEIVNEKINNDKADEIRQSFSKSNLYKELKTEFQLNDEQIKQLLTVLKAKTNILDLQNVEKLIQMSIKTNPLYYDNQAFVFLIEQALLTNKRLNKLIIENNFQLEGTVKSPAELLNELEKSNKDNTSLVKYVRTELLQELEEIKRKDLKSNIECTQLPIAEWGIKQINNWSEEIKSRREQFSNLEAIAVIKRANFLFTGYHLTDTQILCSLIALKNKSNTRGKLLQVATGEGKSTIVCILAIINALKNKQVHVITSSPVLAERDSKQKMKLFKMFHLTCSDNNDKTIYLHGRKDCYTADIVYGEVSQFQFDTLRDQYSMLGTLGVKECEIAIVDEVDSMLIDDSSKIARLSSTAAGMDYFQLVYVYIWQRLLTIKERFIMFNNTMYMVNGKVGFENGKILLEYLDDNNNILKIPDLESYVSKNKDISDIGEVINGDLDDYLKKCLDQYLASLISEKKLEISKNYKEFYETQKLKWIHNAIEALNYQENIHYIVQEGQIKPVDYYSTGIVQSSTNWSDGLHQFLQIKHNLKMTSETFTTNFLSNIGFINNYKNIYGLTGTLGSEKAKKVLKDVYNVDLVNVPQLRQKQYLELETIVVQDETKWLEEIRSTVLIETKKDRGILIICENIAHANILADLLKSQHRSTAIKLYTMNNMNQEKHVEKILPSEIIIATNLAGRGTDIRTDDIEEFGGLHVVLTFMPNNQRVEDQAFGRTARQGKRGTGLMILNSMNLIDCSNVNTTEVKLQRDVIESNMLNEFQNHELKLIQTKDKLFKQFCTFLNEEIRLDIRNKQGCFETLLNKAKELFKHVMPTVYEANLIASIEEQWAMFLRKLDDNTIGLENAEKECKKLIDTLRNNYKEENIIKNPYYHTAIANDIIVNEWSIRSSSKVKHALSHFEKAIQLDEASSGAAHLGIAWCSLIIQDENYKKKALESFNKSLNILSNEMAMLNAMQLLLEQKQPAFIGSELYKQLTTKATILGTYLNSIQNNIGAIKKSLRLIDLIETKQQSSGNVLEKIEHHYELERNSKNKLEIKMDKKASYTLTFNDLTSREDSGTIDQALIAINEAYSKNQLKSSYNGVRLALKQVPLDRMKILFNQNKEFLDLTKESAIDKLKSERSFWNTCRITSSYPIDLTIIHSDNKTEVFKNKQINELISLIETKADEKLRFNILIKDSNVNEINNYFKNTADISISLQVHFDGLDYESANEKLSSIKAESINIEMVAIKSILLSILDRNKYINTAKVHVTEQKLYEKVNRDELLKRAKELKNDDSYFYIKLESLQTHQIKSLINDCKEMSFNISFIGIDLYNSINGLNGQANFYFANLNNTMSEIVIKDLRKENIEFSLEFKDLTNDQVEYIVAHTNLDQENIQINKVKNIMELYTKGSVPTLELNEFIAKGIEYMIEISEKRFIPWRSIIAVAALASIQVIAGGVLIATGFGSTVGMGLITEGIADMFTAYRAFSNRQFSWSDYCKQKAVSLIISAVSMGYSKLKDAGKGIKTLVGSAGTEAVEQVGTQFATNAKTIGQTVTQTGKNLKGLAFKYTGVKAGEAIVREGLNSGIQYLSNFSFDLIESQISELVQSRIRSTFSKPDLTYLLRKTYALDLQTKTKMLQCKVDQIVADTINPQHDFARRQWDSIGLPLLKGILADSKNYGSAISMAFRIIGTLKGLHTVQTLIDNVYAELVKKLSQIDKNAMTFTLILHRNLKIDKEDARSIANKLRNMEIIDENDNLNVSSYYDVSDDCIKLKRKIDEFNRRENEVAVAQFMKSFCDKYMEVEYDSFSIIIKSVADKITEQLIQVLESQMIQPWSTLAVSHVTSNLSAKIQHHYLVDKDQNSDSQNEDQEKYDELKNKTNLTEEEKTFMKNYGKYRTFAEQINYNSRDYCIAYTQCEVAYYAKTSSTVQNGKEVDKKVEERADDVRNNRPATMAEISLMMKKYGIKLKIVNDKNYQRTQEEIDNGVEVIYVEKGSKDDKNTDQVGHAYYIDANGNRFDIETKLNDCFYGVFSKILETKGINKSIEDIRNELADDIISNTNYSKVIEAEKWIHDRHPQEANSLLFSAGLDQLPELTG